MSQYICPVYRLIGRYINVRGKSQLEVVYKFVDPNGPTYFKNPYQNDKWYALGNTFKLMLKDVEKFENSTITSIKSIFIPFYSEDDIQFRPVKK